VTAHTLADTEQSSNHLGRGHRGRPQFRGTLLHNKAPILQLLPAACLRPPGILDLVIKLFPSIVLLFEGLLLHPGQFPSLRHCTQRTEEHLEYPHIHL
jgi:hypothetical protein